jgi:carbon starvation protein
MEFVGITTLTAAVLNIRNIYLPQVLVPETIVPGIINLSLTVMIIICVFVIVSNAVPRWIRAAGLKQMKPQSIPE